RADPDGWRRNESGTRTPACTSGGRLRSGRGSLSACEHERLREGADQLLFGSTAGRRRGAGQGALILRGDLAPGRVRGATRTLLRPPAESTHLGAFPGSTYQAPRSFRWF